MSDGINCIACNQQNTMGGIPITVEHSHQQQPAKVTHVVLGDQSGFKGLVWGFAAFKLAGATLGAATVTVMTLPLLPFGVPVVSGVATYCLASMTSSCVENASYHLGPRKFTIIQ